MKNILAFFLSFFVLFSAYAEPICKDSRLGLHVGTWHFDRDTKYREFNPGIFASCNNFTAGTYANSEYNQSYYFGYLFEYKVLGLFAGGVTGYSDNLYKLQPMLIPSIKVPNTPIRINYLPQQPNKEKNTQGIHITLEYKF